MVRRIVASLALLLSLALLVSLLPPAPASAQQPGSPWPMFGHDVRHTGVSSVLGPSDPVVKWRFLTGSFVYSSPAIAADGTIYVGGADGELSARAPDGKGRRG